MVNIPSNGASVCATENIRVASKARCSDWSHPNLFVDAIDEHCFVGHAESQVSARLSSDRISCGGPDGSFGEGAHPAALGRFQPKTASSN